MKYKGYTLEQVPSEKFPELVSISKGKVFKRFINETKAKTWIEAEAAKKLIENGDKKAKSELEQTVIND